MIEPHDVAIAVAGFVAGIVAGVLLRDAFEIVLTGKGFLVSTVRRLLAVRPSRPSLRTVGIVLVLLALAANAVVGFLAIASRTTALETARDLREVVECQEDYNRAQGEALLPRDTAAGEITREEVRLWTDYLATFELAQEANSRGELERIAELQTRFADRIREYRDDLEGINATRFENPFPDPELCRDLVR